MDRFISCQMKNILAVAAASFTLLITPSISLAQSCPAMLRFHGFLSRAQFTCPFRYYNPELLDTAKACRAELGESEFTKQVASGMRTFDARAQEQGMSQLCRRIKEDFKGQISN